METNGGAGASDTVGRPWQEVHKTLAASMKERLEPYRTTINIEPHFMRGSYHECRFLARIHSRKGIDDDPTQTTARVTIDLRDTGMTFAPGDRLAVMPMNGWKDVEKVAGALGLVDLMDEIVPFEGDLAKEGKLWKDYAKHEGEIRREEVRFTVRDLLRRGQLAPITKDMVAAVGVSILLVIHIPQYAPRRFTLWSESLLRHSACLARIRGLSTVLLETFLSLHSMTFQTTSGIALSISATSHGS